MRPIEARLAELSSPAVVPGLERIRGLLSRLGRPERGLRVVQVAGSNGKGSVCRTLESVLVEAGHRTGLFISPHLVDFTERFRMDGRPASRADLELAAKPLWKALREQARSPEGPATFFEALTALAFLHYARLEPGLLILETGLGGRFDSTNVCAKPLLSVITGISLEHQAFLGDTAEAIAFQKAGICRKGTPLATTAAGAARAVILREFRALQAGERTACRALRPGLDWSARLLSEDLREGSQLLRLELGGKAGALRLGLLGEHQHQNLACALAALELLGARGLAVPPGALLRGLAQARWPGRLQVLGRAPLRLLDGAHNPDGARVLAAALRRWGQGRRLALCVGMLKDKDWRGILSHLAPLGARFFLAQPPDARGLEPEAARELLHAWGWESQAHPSVSSAWHAACRWAGKGGLACATGSLYTVGALLKALKKPSFH